MTNISELNNINLADYFVDRVTLPSSKFLFKTFSIGFNIAISLIVCYLVVKISSTVNFLFRLRKLSQLPSHGFFGHTKGLLPPPYTSSHQFGKELKGILDGMQNFLHQTGFMVLWLTWFPVVVITDHNILQKLISGKIEKGPGFDVARTFFGDGLVMQNFIKWKGRRKLLSPGFHGTVINSYLPIISQVARKWAVSLEDFASSGSSVDILRFTQKTGMDLTCETALGIGQGVTGSPEWQYRKAIEVAIEMILLRAINPLYWFDLVFRFTVDGKRSSKAANFIKSFTTNLIENKKKIAHKLNNNLEHNKNVKFSLLDLLMNLHFQNINCKTAFTVNDIFEETNTTLFAGNETTASAMAWTLWLLGCHPEIQEMVYSELIENGLSDNLESNELYSEESLKSLKYLECCIKESMRICPPIHTVTRKLSHDLETSSGQVIPKGTILALAIYYIHRNPKYYPEPEVYRPERFTLEACAKRPSMTYIPFGFGQRQCIGQSLAIRQIKVVVAEVIRRYQVISDKSLQEIEGTFLGTYKPFDSLMVKLKKR